MYCRKDRGYNIQDLAENCCFEEVAYLLIYERLPTATQLKDYKHRLNSFRPLPQALRTVLENIPAGAHPMDVLKTSCSFLGAQNTEDKKLSDLDIFDSLIARFGGCLMYWNHFHNSQIRIDTSGSPNETIASHFLRLMNGKDAPIDHVRTLDASLILYAEHGFAASTFACRVTTSTRSDPFSAIVTAIGTLRGPLHGGANEAAMHLIQRFPSPEVADCGIREILRQKQKVMGFGHRVYKDCDPRNAIIKNLSKILSETDEGNPLLFNISEVIENVMWSEKRLFPNLDFYAASAYHQCGIRTDFFTPIFVIARTAGWSAHIMEQKKQDKLIRPAALYIGPDLKSFVPIKDRILESAL